jgi:parvulin-like peptidyl-prolyl isomerase
VVLSLGDQSVRRSAFEHHVAELELPEQVGVDVAVERALFDVFVEEQLLLLAARERGLVSPDADQGASETAVRRLVAEIAGGVPAVGDTDARRYYEAHLDEFQAQEMVALRQILVVTLNEARDVRRRLTADPKSFEMLARRLSRGPEASEGGRMGTFARGELPAELESAAFGLRVGGTSGIIESPLGFHVLRVDERQEPHSLSFEQCRDEIVARLEQTRADGAVRAFVRSLRARAQVNHDAATHPVLDRS